MPRRSSWNARAYLPTVYAYGRSALTLPVFSSWRYASRASRASDLLPVTVLLNLVYFCLTSS